MTPLHRHLVIACSIAALLGAALAVPIAGAKKPVKPPDTTSTTTTDPGTTTTTDPGTTTTTTTSPPPPPGPPSAYVDTATYNNGCTDWQLQSTYPMSATDPQWVFTCSSTDGSPDSYYWTSEDSYYWNADQQTVILYKQAVWDSDGWYWDCTLYPSGYGACNA